MNRQGFIDTLSSKIDDILGDDFTRRAHREFIESNLIPLFQEFRMCAYS